MKIDHLEATSFRNIAAASVPFGETSTVLVGKNAQGKTNLVEAVYLLACGKSFRTPRWRDLVSHGQERAVITADILGEGLPFQLKMVLDRKEGKAIYKNGVRLSKLSEFLGLFRVVLFCPEHLSLIKDGPGKRRSFIDSAICQLRPYYASLLNEFNKVEMQRSALLKKSGSKQVSPEEFEVWNQRLSAVSVKIACLRADYIQNLNKTAPEHFYRISSQKEKMTLSYESDVYMEGKSREEMEKRYLLLLEKNFASDQKYGFTQKGVHRDDLEILIDSFSARSFSSQGQQRSAVLSLKLAEGEISRNMTGKDPVYLLDDVLSELDESRREYITGGLAGKQVILTGTDEEDFLFVDRKIRVSEGSFTL